MADNLKGTIAVVTGAAGGIGRATCARLSEQGAVVIGVDRMEDPGDIRAALYRRMDITDPDEWASVARLVESQFGELHCMVNNAGMCVIASIAETSLKTWRQTHAVNVESMLIGIQAFLPLLRLGGAGRAGGASVVNVSSVSGLRGNPWGAAYAASKGAVTLFTKSAAIEFGLLGWPIRVNSVHPGPTDTPMMDTIHNRFVDLGAFPSTEAARTMVLSRTCFGKYAEPEEIAAGIAFLCSPAASFMSGSEMVIDGGYTCR
jgi:NAD(P)-dependent dehydrogenase (short-subunit alcohol dehydrogenase family)